MKRPAGFSLIELMLVMVVISLGATMVVMTLPDNQNKQAEKAAKTFYHKMQMLNEEAVLGGKEFGIYFNKESTQYEFVSYTIQDQWQPIERSRFFKVTQLPEDLKVNLKIGSTVWEQKKDDFLGAPITFDHMVLDEKKEKKIPQIWLSSSGEMTPFELSFGEEIETGDNWLILVDETGRMKLQAPGEELTDEEMARFHPH